MIRRLLVTIVAFSLTAAACGTLNPESLAFAEDEVRPGQTILRLATYTTDGFIEAIEEWEREHPTVDVVLDVRPSEEHHARALEPRSDTITPDVIAIEASHTPSFRNKTDLFVDLKPSLDRLADVDAIDWRLEQGRADDGTFVALPVDVGGLALVYRSDLVEPAEVARLGPTTWCELITGGDAYADRTGDAFIAGAAGLFEAVLTQSDLQFHDESGDLIHASNPAVRDAWNTTMRALGQPPLGDDPCPRATDVQRISADLTPFSDEWNTGLRNGDFAAILAPAWMLDRIQTTAPETAGAWHITPIPGRSGNSGGTHLAIHVDSPRRDLAQDLISYLRAPTTQRVVFESSGHLPATTAVRSDGWLTTHVSPFFGDTTIGGIYVDSVAEHVAAPTGPDYQLILREFRSAVSRVEAGALTPEEAWTEALWRVTQFLG